MQALTFKRIDTVSKEYIQVFNLREEVLRKPLGLSLYNEDLSDEVNDYILIAKSDDELVACLILSPRSDVTLQLRQMAVSALWQKKGIGKQLVEYAEQYAWERNYCHIMLHARIVAKAFYSKIGYKAVGEEFEEVGVPHIKMEKNKN